MSIYLDAELSEAAFIDEFGSIYEHADWVAKAVYKKVAKRKITIPAELQKAMYMVVDGAPRKQQLQLIQAHPDLAGKAARAKSLTTASTEEQASAGLDQLTEAEYDHFTDLNDQYVGKFGFPFIKAIRQSNKAEILAAFAERLPNTPAVEFDQALREIHRIAAFRLAAKFPGATIDTNLPASVL